MINFFLHASILQFYSSFYIEKMFTIFHSTSFFFLNDKSNKKNINFQIFLSLIIFKTQNWIKVFHLKTKRIFGVKSSDVFGSPITIICMRYYIHNYIYIHDSGSNHFQVSLKFYTQLCKLMLHFHFFFLLQKIHYWWSTILEYVDIRNPLKSHLRLFLNNQLSF